ncbi:MAG: ArsR family transcriptional regulator [Candidatus Odinarchaeota archaeon]
MNKVPEPIKRQILDVLRTPKKIQDISEGIGKSKKSAAQYLRILLKQGEVEKIADFEDLRSFFYVKSKETARSV